MSKFSGKCDLYDHIMGRVKNNADSFEDELACFAVFKEKTQGVLYQHIKMNLTPFNVDKEIERHEERGLKKLQKIHHTEVIKDKRSKTGERVKEYDTYLYLGEEYDSLSKINKRGYYSFLEFHFKDIFDLIPFYPYIIASCCCTPEKEVIYISDKPDPLDRDISLTEAGLDPSGDYYRTELKEHFVALAQAIGNKKRG